MADLREILESLGHRDVRTYIQSGNAVFTDGRARRRRTKQPWRSAIRAAIAERLDLDVDVMVRSRDDLADALARRPVPRRGPEAAPLAFLSEAPSGRPPAWRSSRSRPARRRSGSSVGLAYLDLPNGVGRSVLAPLVERRLKVRATARNLATVRTLLGHGDAPARASRVGRVAFVVLTTAGRSRLIARDRPHGNGASRAQALESGDQPEQSDPGARLRCRPLSLTA